MAGEQPQLDGRIGTSGHTAQGHRSITALAEGPFTSLDDRPLTVTLRVPRERLDPGPSGSRFAVQIKASQRDRAEPVLLTPPGDPWGYQDTACPAGLDALLTDRRFLAQHGYAVAASILALFESSLGRRLPWRPRGHRLTLSLSDPIPFEETRYDAQNGIIRFGRLRHEGTRRHVLAALYHDVVAHEVTHAILDGYRPHLADPDATPDGHALHEALADTVAMLSVFGSVERVEAQLKAAGVKSTTAPDLDDRLVASGLFDVANNLLSRQALRRSVTAVIPDAWRQEQEPHRRGEVFVHALMNTVLAIWKIRLALPEGRSSRYQVAETGATAAQHTLAMLIRGLGYTPPVDVTFEDLLRGMLAADLTVVPDDDLGYRATLRQVFAEHDLAVGPDDALTGIDGLRRLRYPVHLSALASDPEEVHRFLWENPALLKAAAIDPDAPLVVERVRPNVRVGPDGFVVSEIGASFVQQVHLSRGQAQRRLGLRSTGPVIVRGGGLLRFDEFGQLTYAALKPVMDPVRQQARLDETSAPSTLDGSPGENAVLRQKVFDAMHRTEA